jgi:hypothetical protein
VTITLSTAVSDYRAIAITDRCQVRSPDLDMYMLDVLYMVCACM